MVTILARSRWTSTKAKGTPVTWSRIRGIVCHYPAMGKSVGVLTQEQETSLLRGWRNYHVLALGWGDIGYNYAIGQSGRVYSLRGDRVGAHARGHNSTTLGVLFIVGDNEPLTKAAQASFRALRATLRKRGASSGLWGHTEMSGNSTRCPGPYIMADIRSGVLKSASAGATVGGASVPVSVPVSGSASVPVIKPATASKTVLKVDGVLGEATAKRIQKGLKVKQDGVIGTDSIKAWQKMHKTPVDGKITGQGKSALSACPAIRKDCLVLGDGGSKLVRAIQIAIGMKGKEADGKLGPNTVKNLQAYYNRLG